MLLLDVTTGGHGGGGRPHATQRDNSVSLLVRNLSYRTTAVDLKNCFNKFGDVRDVYIPLEYHTK
jgi:RNA recognition motif-containing protein